MVIKNDKYLDERKHEFFDCCLEAFIAETKLSQDCSNRFGHSNRSYVGDSNVSSR